MRSATSRSCGPFVRPAPFVFGRTSTRTAWPAWLAGAAATLVLGAPTFGQSFGDHPAEHIALEDVRLEGRQPSEAVRQGLADGRTELQRNARARELERMRSEIAGLAVSDHELFGTPSFVRSTLRMLTAPAPGVDALDVVRAFVAAHPALFEIDAEELGTTGRTRTARDFVTRRNGVRHLSLQQQIDGVDLFGARLKANVTRDGELINVSSALLPRGAGFEVPAVRFSARDAIRLGAEHLHIALPELPTALTFPAGANLKQTWSPRSSFRSDVPLTSELVYFPRSRTDIRPAWFVVLPEPGIGNTYETIVDATDGTVLRVWNQLHYLAEPGAPVASPAALVGGNEDVTLNVFTTDSPTPMSPGLVSPTGAQPAPVARQLVTVTGASVMVASPNGWIDDGVNETLGNNVDAHTDLDADDVADLPRPTGSPYRVFDFPVDFGLDPTSYSEAAVTQLFYLTNFYHDRLYGLGFDEVASNFQEDNFGLGGVGFDRVQADAQDGSAFNNAVFGTSGFDGSPNRMQMYIWDDPNPNLDGDFDSDVVFHELSHGLSIRLHEGTVGGQQSGGMGEGWGDFFGLCLNAEPGDDPDANYAMGGYVTTDYLGTVDNYYFGIRRYPYSTDLATSPLTYADADAAQLFLPPGIPLNPNVQSAPDSVHRLGEIWCNTLVACRSELWADLGFPANELLMGLVVDGMKLSPDNPNMLEARDAILQADIVNHGGANLQNLWEGFALRGMGGQATSPSGSTSSGVVEAFDVPPLIQLQFLSATPTQLEPFTPVDFEVQVTLLASDVPIPNSGLLHYSIDGGAYQTAPMIEGPPDTHTATLPGADCFASVDYYVTVDTVNGSAFLPKGGANDPVHAQVFTSVTTFQSDDFEVDTGWTVGAFDDLAFTGIWVRDDPIGTGAQPENDVTPDPGVAAWVTGQGSVGGSLGENDVDGGKTTLTSPLFDATQPGTRIGYWRWYSNNTGGAPNADVFVVELSNDDGASWVNLETVGPSGPGTAGGWIFHEALVADFLAPTSLMRVRFIAADEDEGSLIEAGVDEFSVFRPECQVCQPDLGQGGPGTAQLSLCGPPLTSGSEAGLALEQAPAGAPTWLLFGGSFSPFPIFGGTLVTGPPGGSIFLGSTDGGGNLFLPGIDGGSAVPTTLYLQALVLDLGQPEFFAISNAVGALFLP